MSESKIKSSEFSLDALKGMQSVRTTFTLPRHAINLISTVANQMMRRFKSLKPFSASMTRQWMNLKPLLKKESPWSSQCLPHRIKEKISLLGCVHEGSTGS